jgi:hypothetical protein
VPLKARVDGYLEDEEVGGLHEGDFCCEYVSWRPFLFSSGLIPER